MNHWHQWKRFDCAEKLDFSGAIATRITKTAPTAFITAVTSWY